MLILLFSYSSVYSRLDLKTAITIDTSTVHCKLEYCNSVYFNLPKAVVTFEIKLF